MPVTPSRIPLKFLAVIFALLATLTAPLQAAAVKVERVTSPGGIEAWLVQDHSNPIIALELVFTVGAALDPSNKLGLAEMASSLLDEGAGDMDSQAAILSLASNSRKISAASCSGMRSRTRAASVG